MRATGEPIAIIGMACRFPGADSPAAFWQLLRNGVDAITEVPPERFDVDAYYDPERKPGKMNTRWGGFIPDVDRFDAGFFGIAPREVEAMDPQQRVLLEIAWEALEDAGLPVDRLTGSQTGVFVGLSHSDYTQLLVAAGVSPGAYWGLGAAHSIAANRLSYVLNLLGPSVAVDTACASSLTAVHLACQSLRQKECDLALAAGVNLILNPLTTIAYSQAHMLSSDGRCKTFDAAANGYVRSEGCGVLVLKPLAAALRDGDPIVALVRGSASNQDGHSNGLTVPNGLAQQAVMRTALRDAGLNPSDIDYVEAHGTGTPVGDPIEFGALKAVFEQRGLERPCFIGSGKTNIGHSESASGIAGLIRAALILRHREVPTHLHFHELNPEIDLAGSPLQIASERQPLAAGDQPLRAGVNSFGFGGSNCHVILEEAARPQALEPHCCGAQLLTLSAKTPEALTAVATALQARLAAEDVDLFNLCYTANARRTHHEERLALVADSRQGFCDQLEAFLTGGGYTGGGYRGYRGMARDTSRDQKIVLVCSGMGSQWIGMAHEMLGHPVFRRAIDRCDEAFSPWVDWSLLAELSADRAHAHWDDIGILQPALFAVSVALATLWRSWGIEPDAVVGHSVGEVAAAHLAGVLSLQDAAHLVCRRGDVLRQVAGQGAMLSVELPVEELTSIMDEEVSIGVINSRGTTVLSGEPATINAIARRLDSNGISCRRVKTDIAFHSPQMDALCDPFVSMLQGLQVRGGNVPIYSTVTGTHINGHDLDAAYWGRNLRQPVEFAQAVECLRADGYDTFLELSSHPILIQSIKESAGPGVAALPSLRREAEWETLLESLGALHAAGAAVQWAGLYPDGGQCVSLPSYPWQRERFWFQEPAKGRIRARRGHPLLGEPIESAATPKPSAGYPGKRVWEIDLDAETFPYLADHRVGSTILLPASAYIEIALAVAKAMGLGSPTLKDFTFIQGMVLSPDGGKVLQVVAALDTPDRISLQFFSLEPGATAAWILHATSTVSPVNGDAPVECAPEHFIAAEVTSGPAFYRGLERLTLGFGPAFQSVERLESRGAESIGRLRVPESIAGDVESYLLHPMVLDGCFQVFPPCGADDLYLPSAIRQLRVYAVSQDGLWVHTVRRREDGDLIEGDVFLYNATNQLVCEVRGYQVRRRELPSRLDHSLYRTDWEALDQTKGPASQSQAQAWPCHWLLLSDRTGLGLQLASLLDTYGLPHTVCFHGASYTQLGPRQYQLDLSSRAHFDRMVAEAIDDGLPQPDAGWPVGIVDLRALDETALPLPETGRSAGSALCVSTMRLVQNWARTGQPESGCGRQARLWLVTRGAQAVGAVTEAGLAQSPLLGLARSLSNEFPELRCKRIDLDPNSCDEEVAELASELLMPASRSQADDAESEVALRSGIRYGYRLDEYTLVDQSKERSVISADEAFRLETEVPGILERLVLRRVARRHPGPGEVEIRVKAAGLNFRDVMSAMGVLPGYANGLGPLGYECSGIVTAVGEDVAGAWTRRAGIRVGDEVIAIVYHAFASYAVAQADLVLPKPAGMSFAAAATIPNTFLTASYALQHLARLQSHERVLIHSGAGGVGMAAIQIAQAIGAEIFATAGSPWKRDLLHSLGVAHVMDSRSLDFVDEVMELTEQTGVDVVLNSLAGAFIPRSLAVLRPYGRFLELGRKDIYANSSLGLKPFQRNLSFFGIDLDHVCRERPAFAGRLLTDIMEQMAAGVLEPLPHTVYPIEDAVDGFRTMAQAKHAGKIVLSMERHEVPVRAEVSCRPDATYLITGGLGGLGLILARWLVAQGGESLVLVGRRSATPEAAAAVEALRAAGCQVTVAQIDVAREDEVTRLFTGMEGLPPLRGIIHAAGVVDDGILLHLNEERFERVLAPKVAGAWNLHHHTQDRPLDFFVLFSSVAALLGGPGQSNYAAANQFLDALACFRRARGLPALSIAWGPWSEVGMAAGLVDRFAMQGIGTISPRQGTDAFARVLGQPIAHLGVVPIDWETWFENNPAPGSARFLSRMNQEATEMPASRSQAVGGPLQTIASASVEKRYEQVELYLRDQIARVLGVTSRKIGNHIPLIALGLDSLMGVELRNRIYSELGVDIPTPVFLDGADSDRLAVLLLEQLATDTQAFGGVPATTPGIEEIIL